MNTYLFAGLIIVLLGFGWVSLSYFHLRQKISAFAHTIRHASQKDFPASSLSEDSKDLEELANAVRMLVRSLESHSQELETERAKLATVLERMTDGVLIADSEGYVTFLNPAAERLFNAPTAIGRTVAEIMRQHQMVEAWRLSRETGEAQEESVEIPALHQFLQLDILPDLLTGGSLLLVQDLTRIRRLEKVRRDFISNVSHELRTPLASLKALTETLRDGALDDPKAAPRFLGRIETEVDALAQMAQELLDLTRIESGQVPLDLKEASPGKILLSTADRMRAQAERANLTIRVETSTTLPDVHADVAKLEQVLVNIIHNAIKFTAAGGSILLSAVPEDRMICFSVKDTGAGIPQDELERVFERFYKADRARSGGGTGLGLSIARHIIEVHGGRIWVESIEGRGSTFYFTIPIF